MVVWRCFRLRRLARNVAPEPTTKVAAIIKAALPGPNAGRVTMTPVVPVSPSEPKVSLSFLDAFGRTGVVMMLVIVISILWTVWLIKVTVDPNGAANLLMDTAQFDDGMLWLIVNAETTLVITNTVSLAVIALGYMWVGVRMTLLRNRTSTLASSSGNLLQRWSWVRWSGIHHCWQWWVNATSYTGPNRKIWNAVNKVIDLVVQSYALHSLMEAGYSAIVCVIYAGLVAINALSCAFFILTTHEYSVFMEIFVDAVFDMLFAVGMPISLLVIAALQFQFDRNRAEMYLRYFPAGWFERETRLVADAAEITTFRISFDGIRTQTWRDWAIRISMNFSFCYRLMRVVEVSIRGRRGRASRHTMVVNYPIPGAPTVPIGRPQRKVPRPLGLLYICASIIILSYTVKSTVESRKVCEAYHQCVAFAQRWHTNGLCPCRALIDVDRAPTSWEAWTNPPNATPIVEALATSGDLRVLQIINRQLRTLPVQLQGCTGLQQLVLMYTGIERFPEWVRALNLELIAVEGQPGGRSLVYLPQDMFSRMSSLMYFHLGAHPFLPKLPSFEGLTMLKTISFAMLSYLQEFPPVEPLVSLERVVLAGSHNMYALPDFSKNRNLVSLIVGDIGACCNGFFGNCKLPAICQAEPIGRCLDSSEYSFARPSAGAQAVFDKFNASICMFNVPTDIYLAPIVEENARGCEGVLYRQCRLSNSSKYFANERGMCYSDRMMAIACMFSPPHEEIRREEIRRGIGTPCDPVEEKWLGCSRK